MAKPTPRKRSSRHGWLPVTVLVLLGVGAVVGTLYVLGDGQLPWTAKAEGPSGAAEPDRAGKKPYPRLARALPAFTAIKVEHLIDPKSKEPLVVWLDPEEAGKRGLLETKQVLGRVLRDDRDAGYAFTERDFLAPGSPDDWSAAIPDGYRGMPVSAEAVPSLRGLKRYTRVSLVAAGDVRAAGSRSRDSSLTADMQRMDAESKAFDAPMRVLVDGAIVLVPMPEKRSSSGTGDGCLAVPSERYDAVLAAVKKGADVSAIVQSGNPNVQAGSLPAPDTAPAVDQIRVNNGGKTETVVLPADGGK